MIRDYFELTKPGIIVGNLLTTIGAYLLAANLLGPGFGLRIGLLVATAAGLSLVIASACVFNNYLDRDIDQKMARTRKRAIVKGTVQPQAALIYATILGLSGSVILGFFTNPLTQGIALLGLFFYVVVYGVAKRRSHFGTVVGSISGAIPPVVGYTAATRQLDKASVILFLILVFWQMPHFYAIAMYRQKDYKQAGIPVLPIKKGHRHTKLQMLAYILAFIITVGALSLYGYTGYTFLAVMGGLGLVWLWLGIRGLNATNSDLWAKKMFRFSLIMLPTLAIMLPLGAALP